MKNTAWVSLVTAFLFLFCFTNKAFAEEDCQKFGISKERSLNNGNPIEDAIFSPDGKWLIYKTAAEEIKLVQVPDGQEKNIGDLGGLIKNMKFSPDSQQVLFFSNKGIEVNQLEGQGTKPLYKNNLNVVFSTFTNSNNVIFVSEDKDKKQKEIFLYNINNKKMLSLKKIGDNDQQFNGSFFYESTTIDLSGGAITTNVVEPDNRLSYSSYPNYISANTIQGQVRGLGRFYRSKHSADPRSVIFQNEDKKAILIRFENVCVQLNLNIAPNTETIGKCINPTEILGVGSLGQVLNNLCRTPYSESLWNDKIKSVISNCDLDSIDPLVPNPIPREIAELYLMQFQKPNGFDPQKHLPILIAVLKSDIVISRPDLIAGALQGVLYSSYELYEQIIAMFPKISELSLVSKPIDCQTNEEKKLIEKSAQNYVESLIDKNETATDINSWRGLGPLSAVLKRLPKELKDEYVDLIADSIANGAAQSPDFRNVFISKLYYLAKEYVNPLFGYEKKVLTDLTTTRAGLTLQPIVFGSYPISGIKEVIGLRYSSYPNQEIQRDKSETKFGFFAAMLPPISLGEEKFSTVAPGDVIFSDDNINWTINNQQYSGSIKISGGSKDQYLQLSESPDYKALLKDNKFTGLIFVGSNLGSTGDGFLSSHLAYFTSEGFVFDKSETGPVDFKKFFSDKIKSSDGGLDYFLKGAHSGGDLANLTSVVEKVKILKGEKDNKDGTKNIVYLAIPSSGNPTYISNMELKELLKDRKEPILYVNGSCGSYSQCVEMISQVQSPRLIPLATAGTSNVSRSSESVQQMLSGFRDKKTYKEIEDSMKPMVQEQAGWDDYIFPSTDNYRYRELIMNRLTIPVEINNEIKGPDGNIYRFQEHIH